MAGLPLASRAAPAVDIWHIGKAAAKANTRPSNRWEHTQHLYVKHGKTMARGTGR